MDEALKNLFREIVNEINRPGEGVDIAAGDELEGPGFPYGLDSETIEILLDDSIATGG